MIRTLVSLTLTTTLALAVGGCGGDPSQHPAPDMGGVIADPCAVNHGGCDQNATCSSTFGAPPTCTCNPPYAGNGVYCSYDYSHACDSNNGGCDVNATCVANGGAPNSCVCHTGYQGDGFHCVVADSCTIDHGGCDAHADCTATGPGTNSCRCQNGYTGDGKSCTPAAASCDPQQNGCDPHADCLVDGAGQKQCVCQKGYDGNGQSCSPIDSCTVDHGGCDPHADCKSTGPGTNSCTCQSGYSGDGKSCSATSTMCTSPTGPSRASCVIPAVGCVEFIGSAYADPDFAMKACSGGVYTAGASCNHTASATVGGCLIECGSTYEEVQYYPADADPAASKQMCQKASATWLGN